MSRVRGQAEICSSCQKHTCRSHHCLRVECQIVPAEPEQTSTGFDRQALRALELSQMSPGRVQRSWVFLVFLLLNWQMSRGAPGIHPRVLKKKSSPWRDPPGVSNPGLEASSLKGVRSTCFRYVKFLGRKTPNQVQLGAAALPPVNGPALSSPPKSAYAFDAASQSVLVKIFIKDVSGAKNGSSILSVS